MIFVKAFSLGVVVYFVTIIFSGVIVGLTTSPDVPDLDVLAKIVTTSLLVWYGLAATLLLLGVKSIKVSRSAFIARTLFIWAPISFGWFVMLKSGAFGWYMLGLVISTLFLSYEVTVNLDREKSPSVTTK